MAAAAFAYLAIAAPAQARQSGSGPAAPVWFGQAAVNPHVDGRGLEGNAFVIAPAAPAIPAAAPTPPPRTLEIQVAAFADAQTRSAEEDCLANAVYFEARGESLEGQLAVAEVVKNRAASGRYPATLCGVVVQHAQFSFVRRGIIPSADRASQAWRRAVAVARIAEAGGTRMLPDNVLWYHANYVSPSWGRRLSRTSQIGAHIFYR